MEKTKKKVQTHGQGLGYPHTNQKTKKPKNQKTKKPKNQKTKKTKNQKTKKPKKQKNKKNKKNKIAHPKGRGSDAECWVLSFFVFLFFWFFGLCVDSHCRCAKQRLPGTVSGCTTSKVDTLQYSNVCYDIVHSANDSREEWNSILSGCAICCWIFAQEMLQFAHSHSGLFC